MPRIAGVDVPNNKRAEVALTSIFGVGKSRSQEILEKVGLDPNGHPKKSIWSKDSFAPTFR